MPSSVDTRKLRRKLLQTLRTLPKGDTPECKRHSVEPWRVTFAESMFGRKPSLHSLEDDCLSNIAEGRSLQVEKIEPAIFVCEEREHFDIYDYFRMWSSFPTVDRPGRRVKFLVRDVGHPRRPLMGICCLSSAVRQISVRDQWIGWDTPRFFNVRCRNLAHILDISTCVSLPPYSFLTAGKLMAAMMASNEIRAVYRSRYSHKRTRTLNRIVTDYVLLTTLGGYGRNAPVYKGLSYSGSHLFKFVGYTRGYSTFQIPPKLYTEIKKLVLSRREHSDATVEGGANAKLRILRFAARELDIPEEKVVFSGQRRAVFCAPVATNWREILLDKEKRIDYADHKLASITETWKSRWLTHRMDDRMVVEQVCSFDPEQLRMSCLLRKKRSAQA